MTNERPRIVRCGTCGSPCAKLGECVVCARGRFVLEEFAEAGAISNMQPTSEYQRKRYAILTEDLDRFGPGWRDLHMRLRGKARPADEDEVNPPRYDREAVIELLKTDELFPAERDVAERFWIKGETRTEIAAARRVTFGTVNRQVCDVRARLRGKRR